MTLQKAKKSVQLYGGISDDVDSFLIQPPAIEYAENCHWRNKEGKLMKRLGSVKSTDTGKPSESADPTILHSIGDKLYAFGATQSHEYDYIADSWSSKDQIPFFVRTDAVGSGQTHAGVTCQDVFVNETARKVYLGYSIKVQASHPQGTTVERATFRSFIQVYDLDNFKLLNTIEVPQAAPAASTINGPVAVKFFNVGTTTHAIWCDNFSTANVLYQADIDSADDTLGSPVLIFGDVYCGSPREFGETAYKLSSSRKVEGLGITTGTPWYAINPYQGINSDDDDGTDMVLAVTDSSGDVRVFVSSDGFVTKDEDYTITRSADYYRPLAVAKGTSGHTDYYILLAEDVVPSTPPAGFDTRIYKQTFGVNSSAGGTFSINLSTDSEGLAVNGSLFFKGSSIKYAVGYYRQSDAWAGGDQAIGTEINTISTALGVSLRDNTFEDSFYAGHRITTQFTQVGSDEYIGMQQWPYPEMFYNDTSPDDTALDYFGYFTPVSTALVNVSDTTTPKVAAVVDTSQSKHTDFTDAITNQHVGTLVVDPTDDNRLLFGNREVFGAEGAYGVQTGGADFAFHEQYGAESRINLYATTLDSGRKTQTANLGDGLVVAAGAPLWFDGDTLSELDPLGSPFALAIDNNGGLTINRVITFNLDNLSSSSPDDFGFRQVQAIVGYTDSKGNIHRSAPSPAIWLGSMTPDALNFQTAWEVDVTWSVPLSMNPERMSDKYFIEVYVGNTNDGTDDTPRLALRESFDPKKGSVVTRIRNQENPTGAFDSNSIPITRNSKFVYTEGGELAADPFPNFTHTVATATRLWALSAEDRGQVYYSKLFQELTSPEFNAALVVSLGDERLLTAIGRIDDKVIVFERDRITAIYGPGPDNTGRTGRQGGFEIDHITSDVGCDDQSSVVEVPNGLMFLSRRGFYILDRSLRLTYIGGPAHDITRNTRVITANIVPEFAEVRFHLEVKSGESQVQQTGPAPNPDYNERPARPKYGNTLPTLGCVVYNYELGRWTVFSNYPATATTLTADGRYARIRGNYDIFVESAEEDDNYLDGTTKYYQKVTSAHIPLADTVQGYSRCRRITALGRYMSSWNKDGNGDVRAGDVEVTVNYSHERLTGLSDSYLWRANKELQGGNDRFQVRFKPKRQKVSAIQVTFEEKDTTAYTVPDNTYTLGRGFEISDINFDLGVKEGPARDIGAPRKK